MKRGSKSKKCTKSIENNESIITPEIISKLYEMNSTNNINKNNVPIIKLLILNNNLINKSDYYK